MPGWAELLNELTTEAKGGDQAASAWLEKTFVSALTDVSALRSDRNVLFYASAFLQKPRVPPEWLSIAREDLNGFMSALHGMECSKGLTLLLHTPGGDLNAIETVVSYLWSKFDDIEVVVPTYAMSAGTMLALASDRILMGRQSQLGPTDPQLGGVSAGSIVEQFDAARKEILANPVAAHAWAPVLQVFGPALYQSAKNALTYAERMVAEWLEARMFRAHVNAKEDAAATARHFGDSATHRSHGRRIDRDEARVHGVVVENLEADQALQDAVLTAYHIATLLFEKSPATKLLQSPTGVWLKNYIPPR